MAVAGAPEARPDHASAAMELARGMLVAAAEARARLGVPLELRVGLASGPVVGGVIGKQRILFDLWGLLGDPWVFEERAPTLVKGLGSMTTYLASAHS